jgi:RNA polymerase sigma-70 factor, ECF subfamily
MMETVIPARIQESEDDAAMSRVAKGDGSALAWLFDRHKARLFGFLYHMTGDGALAEDLLGEAFLRVYQARGRYRSGAGFVPWLFCIARNLAVGEMRKRAVQDRACRTLMEEAAVAAREPDRGAERSEICERVRGALLALPEDQRTAVVLKEYQELSYREIACVLGCSEEAARARTYRARQALRLALRDWWEAS